MKNSIIKPHSYVPGYNEPGDSEEHPNTHCAECDGQKDHPNHAGMPDLSDAGYAKRDADSPMTIQRFRAKHPEVAIEAVSIPERADRFDDWGERSAHWRVTLTGEHGSHSFNYTMGPGLRVWKRPRFGAHYTRGWSTRMYRGFKVGELAQKPRPMTVDQHEAWKYYTEPVKPNMDVLETLASDWASIEDSRTFAEWAENLGMSSDSIKEKKAYDGTLEASVRARQVIGGDAYQDVMSIEW